MTSIKALISLLIGVVFAVYIDQIMIIEANGIIENEIEHNREHMKSDTIPCIKHRFGLCSNHNGFRYIQK